MVVLPAERLKPSSRGGSVCGQGGESLAPATFFTPFIEHFELLLGRHDSAFVLISGGAGVGKSCLLGALRDSACVAGWSCRSMTVKELRELAKWQQPTVAFVDDLGRGDQQGLAELLAGLIAPRTSREPLVVVLAVRASELEQMPELTDLLQERGSHFALETLTRSQVEEQLRGVLAERDCQQEVFNSLVKSTEGHPLLVRLMLERLKTCAEVTESDAQAAMDAAYSTMCDLVWAPLLADLSDGDLAFLEAMALDDEPSRMQHITSRLGKTPQYAGVYRQRLVAAEIIRAASYGKVTFVTPLLRTYVRQLMAQRMEEQF